MGGGWRTGRRHRLASMAGTELSDPLKATSDRKFLSCGGRSQPNSTSLP